MLLIKALRLFNLKKTVTLFFILQGGISYSQDNIPYFLKNSDWVQSSDSKNWEKLVNKIPDADKLMQQSNNYYLQMGNIESDASLDENKKQKQLAKIETQAIDYYNKSLFQYKEIYISLYSLLEKNIGESQKSHPAYKDMVYFNNQASAIYTSISDAATDEDRKQISQANEYKLTAIEKGISAINVSPENYTSITDENSTEQIPADDIRLNTELYKKYKDYIDNPAIPDPVVINQIMQLEGDDASFEAFKSLWNKYQTIEGEKLIQQQQIAEAVIDVDSVNKATEQTQFAEKLESGVNTTSADETGTSTLIGTDETNLKTAKTTTSKTKRDNTEQTGNNVAVEMFESTISDLSTSPEYRVQLAASRIPLNLYQVTSIYRGPLSITEVKDGNYYKYQIRSFRLYTDAQLICSQSKVDNAYLEAYQSGSLMQLALAVKQTRNLETQVKKYGRERTLHEIDFAVQLAASKVRLSSTQLSELYNAQWPITIVVEEGWYKYQILAGDNLKEALNILENSGENKAFLVAYKNGRKLKLYKALNEYKSYTP
jgi:hypothetical protein